MCHFYWFAQVYSRYIFRDSFNENYIFFGLSFSEIFRHLKILSLKVWLKWKNSRNPGKWQSFMKYETFWDQSCIFCLNSSKFHRWWAILKFDGFLKKPISHFFILFKIHWLIYFKLRLLWIFASITWLYV